MQRWNKMSHVQAIRNPWISAALTGAMAAAGCNGSSGGPVPLPTATPGTTATPTVTATPSNTSKIVFSSLRDGNKEIYIMNGDGSGQTRLTNSPAQDTEPALSGDRSQIAFVSNRNGTPHIYTMRADGSALRRLTGGNLAGFHPSFSRDGRKIAYERAGSIALMNADGSSNIVVVPKDKSYYFSPSLSPDGQKILFSFSPAPPIVNANERPAISIVDANGANRKQLTKVVIGAGGDFDPTFSPDSQTIAFARGSFLGTIWLMNADGSRQRPLALTERLPSTPESLSFSPDGRQIAFAASPTNSPDDVLTRDRQIYRVDINGANLTRLTNNSSDDTAPSWK